MSEADLTMLVHVVILLIVSITAAINVWTHIKVSNLPTTQQQQRTAAQIADAVAENGKGIHSPELTDQAHQ